jgi:hypothetical protein
MSGLSTTHLVMSPLEFRQRLAALVPRPRMHLIRFHGVLAPNAKLRAMMVPQGPPNQDKPATEAAAAAECEVETVHAWPHRIRSRHGAARDKDHHASRQPQAPCELGRAAMRSRARRGGHGSEMPLQAVDGCARPGSSGGVGFTQGLSSSKRAFEFPVLRVTQVPNRLSACAVGRCRGRTFGRLPGRHARRRPRSRSCVRRCAPAERPHGLVGAAGASGEKDLQKPTIVR